MKPTKLNQKNFNYVPLGFAIPFIGMLMIMILNGVLPFGSKSLLYSDSYHQYYPFFKAFRNAILSGDSLLYSWNIGLGIDYLGLIAYYVASPLNLFSLLIPESLLLYYFTYLTPVRLGLAGLFFSIFLNRTFKKNDLSVPLFGSFYALCAWALGYQWNVMWLDTFALLPLVALGTLSLLNDKKFILYTVSLFLSVFSNYYIGFFTCIFVFITFICYQICRWSGFKKFLLDLCSIATFSILAIGMTAILELPAFISLQSTNSSVNNFPKDFQLNIVKAADFKDAIFTNWNDAKTAWADENYKVAFSAGWTSIKTAFLALLNGMKQVAGASTGGTAINLKESNTLPNIYCGVFTILFASLFLTIKQIKIREKVCAIVVLIFLSLSFIIRQLDYIWHGFHFTNMIPYRFSFIYSFVMLYLGYRAYIYIKLIKPWQIAVSSALSLIPVILSNDFTAFIETISSSGYWREFSSALANFSFSQSSISKIFSFIKDFYYPVYNFFIIISSAIILLIGSVKLKFPKNEGNEEKLTYIKKFRNRQKVTSVLMLCVIVLELILNLVNYSLYWSGASISNYPKGTTNSEEIFELMHDLENDGTFYRAETSHTHIFNDGALNGYNGITTFTSSANVQVTKFMKALGYGAKETYNRYAYESSSPIPELFLNLKYVVDRDGFYYEGPMIRTDSETKEKYTGKKAACENPYYEVVGESSTVALVKNKTYLPLGFLCNDELAEFEFDNSCGQFVFEEQLVEAATGNKYTLWHAVSGELLSIEGDENVSVTSSDSQGKCRYTASEDGIVTYSYTADREGLFCVDIEQGKRNNFSAWLNNNHDSKPDERIYSETYSLPQMISVCAVQPGDVIEIQFECEAGDTAQIKAYGSILDNTAFMDAYNTLAQSTLNVECFSNTYIEGTIDCHMDGLMYTSVPQNGDCWTIYVDGKLAEIELIGEVMIGVHLSEGTHKVTFEYKNKAFTAGCIISIISAAIFCSLWIIFYKPYKQIPVIITKIKAFKFKNLFRQKGKYDK